MIAAEINKGRGHLCNHTTTPSALDAIGGLEEMNSERSFTVEMEIKRLVTAVVVAEDAASARAKASNLELKHQIEGEITGWEIISVSETAPDGPHD